LSAGEKAAEVYSTLKREAASGKLTLEGGPIRGKVRIRGLEAIYSLQEGILTLEVTKLPILASWGMVEKALAEWAAGFGLRAVREKE
jgi:hypothetical protein